MRESIALYPALERIDVDRSFDQIRAAPALRPIPIVVLSADRPWGPQVRSMIAAGKLPADVPPDFGYVVDAAQKKAHERLANLVPNEKHITHTNSGHEIHKEKPQLVIGAIREVVEAVRSGKPTRWVNAVHLATMHRRKVTSITCMAADGKAKSEASSSRMLRAEDWRLGHRPIRRRALRWIGFSDRRF